MGLFDVFKKKEPGYDPNNIKLSDLRTGFIFDYDLKNWQVVQSFEYQWQNNFSSLDFVIDNGTEQKFLSVEDDDGLFVTIMDKIKIRTIDEDLPEIIIRDETPPKKLQYKDTTFFLDEESVGTCYEEGAREGSKLISWDYFDEDDKFILSIEQWGENDFEAFHGVIAKEYEFSNICPAN